jgi:hypothetical protein
LAPQRNMKQFPIDFKAWDFYSSEDLKNFK